MNCYERKRRTKGLFTFPNEEHGRAPRGCGDGAAGAMAFPIVNGKADFVTIPLLHNGKQCSVVYNKGIDMDVPCMFAYTKKRHKQWNLKWHLTLTAFLDLPALLLWLDKAFGINQHQKWHKT